MTTNPHLAFRYLDHADTRPIHAVSGGKAWLSPGEREVVRLIRDRSRRHAWLCGRAVAKGLILEELSRFAPGERGIHPAEIEIYSRDSLGRVVRPRITLRGRLRGWNLSIAHSDGAALAAFSCSPGVLVGADLVPILSWCPGFLDVWLTPAERRWVRSTPDRATLVSACWAVKEAAYKAVNAGDRFIPAAIEVCPRTDGTFGCHWAETRRSVQPTVTVSRVGRQIVALVAVLPPADDVEQEDGLP